MTVIRDQLFPQKPHGSHFRFSRIGVQPSPGSSTIELPSAFAESGAYLPHRELPGSLGQGSLPLACCHPPEGHQIGARKRRTTETPSSANHTAAASQPTGRIAKAASWLHLSRLSPALHPPERPSHTHTPNPGFGGRGHEIMYYRMYFLFIVLTYSPPPIISVYCACPLTNSRCGTREAHISRYILRSEKLAHVIEATLRTAEPSP